MIINGVIWDIQYVPAGSECLRRSDGSLTVGMTNLTQKTVYLDSSLRGWFLRKVLCHEIVHVFCFSYDVSLPIETEEIVADFVSTYGSDIVSLTDRILNDICIA